jgi:hypothetical protein
VVPVEGGTGRLEQDDERNLALPGLLRCQECSTVWLPNDYARWRAYLTADDQQEAVLYYCAECAEREFGNEE